MFSNKQYKSCFVLWCFCCFFICSFICCFVWSICQYPWGLLHWCWKNAVLPPCNRNIWRICVKHHAPKSTKQPCVCLMTSSNGTIFRVTGLFVRGIHRPPVGSPHKSQCRGALTISLIYAWINDWANDRDGDLRRHRAHYDVMGHWVVLYISMDRVHIGGQIIAMWKMLSKSVNSFWHRNAIWGQRTRSTLIQVMACRQLFYKKFKNI